MNTVLVTAIGSFASSEVIGKLKINNRVVGCDIYDRRWLANSNEVSVFYQVPLAINKEEYINCILDICKKEKVDYIMPLTDVEVDVFNVYRNSFEERGVVLCISSADTIELCRDKFKTYEYLNGRGIDCLIESAFLRDVRVEDVKLPVVIKPCNGRSSESLHYVETKEELVFLFDNLDNNRFIVQKKIEGEVVTVDVCRNPKDKTVVCVPREEWLRTLNGAGTSVQILNDSYLIETAGKIAEELNICGTVNFEFILNEEGFYFIECNPRFSGGVAFSGVAGYDFVNNALNCFMDKGIDPQVEIKEQFIVKKYVEVVVE